MTAPPQTGAGPLVFAGIFGFLNIIVSDDKPAMRVEMNIFQLYWICLDLYTKYHIRWKTSSDDSGLLRLTLIITLLIFINCMVLFAGHLPKIEEMKLGSVNCVVISDDTPEPKKE